MTAPAEMGLVTALIVIGGVALVVAVGVYVWYALALSTLFPRLDAEGWKGWVPVLNEAEILARGGVPPWAVVFYFIPIVQLYGVYLKIVATHRINTRFGRGAGATILAILLPPVWASLLAWGAPPYPDGDRLAALQPGPKRTPQAPAPARDASGYTIPSLSPSAAAVRPEPTALAGSFPAPPVPQQAAGQAEVIEVQPAPPSIWGAPQQQAAPSFAPPPPAANVAPAALAAATPSAAMPSAATPSIESAPEQRPSWPVEAPPLGAPQKPQATAERAVPVAQVDPAPQTGIMAAMSGDAPPTPISAHVQASPTSSSGDAADVGSSLADSPQAHTGMQPVRPAPPVFSSGAQARAAEPTAIRSAPTGPPSDVPPALAPQPPAVRQDAVAPPAPQQAAVPEIAPAPPGPTIAAAPTMQFAPPVSPATVVVDAGLPDPVDKTVVSPRPIDDDLDATVVVARRRGIQRILVLDDGRRFALSGASVVIGRNPDGAPGEQRLAISDGTRTLSKTHARLVVDGDEWRLTDLHSTNGVVVVAEDGTEALLDAGESVVGTGRFVLGEVGMHVIAESAS